MLDRLIYKLTTDASARHRDQYEIAELRRKYGADAPEVVVNRASDRSLRHRDRRHWRRLYRAMKYYDQPDQGLQTD